jgi:hypothetical protein
VSRSIEKRPQDEHVKRSLEESGPLLCLLRHRRHSTLNLATMVDTRLSIVNDQAECEFSNEDLLPTPSLSMEIEHNSRVAGGLSETLP